MSLSGILTDTTEKRNLRERISGLRAVAAALAKGLKPTEMGGIVLEEGLRTFGAVAGMLWHLLPPTASARS